MTLSLVVRRTIRARPERVFSAWTEPAHLERWWGPPEVTAVGVEIDLVVGGRYRIGNRLPDGVVIWIAGRFLAIEAPHRLIYTWGIEPKDDDERVTVRFEARGDATEVIVVHERLADEATREDHAKGWQGCLDGLEALLDQERGRNVIEET